MSVIFATSPTAEIKIACVLCPSLILTELLGSIYTVVMPVTQQWQRLTSAAFHDVVWWTIFGIVEIEYFPDECHKHL